VDPLQQYRVREPPKSDRQKLQEVMKKKAKFNGKGYTITVDNLLKIINIVQRAHHNIPIVIMGATGCGKTYMIDFIANFLFQESFICLTLHSGISEGDIEELLITAINKAKEASSKKRVWLLFDEFNTCPFQCLISEIMTERRCTFSNRIREIPENLVLIAACNPYRIKVSNSRVGLSHESTDIALSHRVYPIPQSLIDYIWDFGRLSDEVETEYIRSMITNDKDFPLEPEAQTQIAKCIITSQKYLRESETDSSVSLRDVQRFLDLYRYFRILESSVDQLIMSVYLCYILRIEDKQGQAALTTRLREELGTTCTVDWSQRIEKLLKEFEEEVSSLVEIPAHVSLNRPLVENLLAIVVSIVNSMPAIICGKPGTSKTLSIGLANDLFNLPAHRKQSIPNRYFRDTRTCIQLQFWGSTSTTSAGISDIFAKARKVKATEENYVCIVFDEIGLAEIADSNPLKVLHSLLESTERNISFIGLSNWKLDLSKMNRVIYVARPDMDAEDLFNTCRLSKGDALLTPYLKGLSKAYHDFRKLEVHEKNSHPNFHGSRDFYQMIRLIKTHVPQITEEPKSEKIGLLIESSIMRNFSGKGKESSDRLLSEYRKQMKPKCPTNIERMSSIDLIFQNMIDNESRHLMVFCETQDIEELIVGEIRRFEANVKGKDPVKFVQLRNTRGSEDLHHLFVNMQMYIKQGYTVVMKDLDIIYGCLYDLLNQNYTVYENRKSCNLFFDNTKHKVTVDPEFKCIILVEDECKLSKKLGIEKRQQPPFLNRFEKHRVTYDDLIQNKAELASIRKMEYQLLNMDKRDLKKEFYPPCKMLHNLSKELVYSRGLNPQAWTKRMSNSNRRATIKEYYAELLNKGAIEGDEQIEEGPLENELAQLRLDSLQSRNFILNRLITREMKDKEREEFKKLFIESHRYNALEDLVEACVTADIGKRYIVFSYSPSWLVKDLVSSMVAGREVQLLTCAEINAKGIVERDNIFRRLLSAPEKVVMIQFMSKSDWKYIQDFRYKLDSLWGSSLQPKTVVLVAHTTAEDVANKLLVPTSINLITENWEMVVIDNLKGCGYDKFFKLLDSSFDDIRTQKSLLQEILPNIILEALNRLISNDTNNYEGLVSVREQVRYITGSKELLEWLTNEVKDKASKEKTTILQYIKKDIAKNKLLAERHLDALDFVMETIQNFFVPAVRKVLEGIEKKAGFGVLVLAGFISADFQKNVFDEWLEFVKCPDLESNPFNQFMFAHQSKKIDFKKFDKRLKEKIMKASDLVKQANRALCQPEVESISFNGEEVELKQVKEKVEGEVWGLVKMKVLEGTEDLVNDYQRVEEKVLFALQVCEIYLTDKGVSFVDQTLRILSVMIQTTFSRQSKYRTEVENSLHNMITLALVLWNLHRKEIEFLVRNTEDKKTVELIRATSALKFYKTYSILSCRDLMGKLFPEQDVTEQGSVQEEIGHYQYFLRNIDVYAMEAGTIRGLKLMVGFLQAWPGEWCEELALEYNKLRRGGTTREEAVQNMILEIIQLAVNKASIESIKSFLDSNLFEILEVLSSSSTDINRRKEVLLSLFKLTFNEVEHSEPTHVTILTRFLFNQHINNDNLNPLRDCLAILQEQCSRRKKPLPRRILWFYSQLVELTSESCAPTILPETLLQDLRSDLELLPGLLSEQKGLSLLAMEEIEIVGRFKARLSRLRTVQATEVANFAPMADRMVREVAGQQGKGHILLILLRGLYCRWPSSEEMRNAGLNYTADLVVSFDAVRSDRFVVVKDGPFSAMKAVFELVQAEPERFSRLESLDYFEKLELLNIAFFGENGCQGDEYSLIVQHRLMNNLCGKFIKEEHVREVVSKREEERDLERAFFVIGHGVNLLESNGVMAQLLRSESALLPCPNDTLQTWLRIRNLYDTRANDQAFKAVWICVQCNCPVILDHCGELAHNDADPSRASKCIGCGIDIGRGHTNLRKIETANWQQQVEEMLREATVRVIYEDLEEEDKSWRREMYPAEVTSEEAATVVHLMDYIIKYARYLRSPYDILGCEDVSTYLFSHILSDIRLLANTIGKDNETITTWLNLLLVDLNGDLEPPVDEMAEARQVDIDICRRTRKSINRLVNKHLKELEDKLSGYGDEKNAKLQRERSLKETQRDYVRGEISNGELLKNYGQRVMEVTTYLRERPQITRQLVIEGLMAKDSLASQFLVRVLKESDLWTSYGTIMQSLKRFSAMISSQYKSCFTPEQCCSSLTLNDLLDGNYPSGEPNEDLRQEFGLLVEILETRLYPLIHRYPDYFEGGFECSMQAQLKKYWLALDRPDNLLAFYVVPINSTSAPAVEEVVMGSLLKCLANIQNKFLQEYSRLSINYSQSDNNVARRIFSKCTEDCFVSIPSEASQRVLDNVFLDVENGERGVSVCIDEQYFAGLVADQAFTNNVQEILVEPMFSLLVAEWSEFKQLIHRVEQVTRARNREDPHKGQEAARVKTCTRNPKLNRLMSLSAQKVWDLQKVLLIVLRRVLEEDISEYEWLEKVVGVKDAKEWREHVELLRDCQILDLGDIRRVLLVALYAAVSLQGPRTMYVEEREGAEKHEKAAVMIADYVVEELKVLYTERVDQHTRKLSREKESRMLEHLSDLLEEEDYKLVGDIMHQLNHNVPEGSDSGKKLTVKEFPGVIKAIEEKYALK
jgi:hypothetical protein